MRPPIRFSESTPMAAEQATESDDRRAPEPHLLFGMPINAVGEAEAVSLVLSWADAATAHVVVTPNTDHFVRWQHSSSFRDLYQDADLAVIDGAPLAALARLEGIGHERVTGADLFQGLMTPATAAEIPVVLIGGQPGVAERASRLLIRDHPGLEIAFHTSPSPDDLRSDAWLADLAAELRRLPVKIVALCLGSPKQEQLFRDLQRVDPELSGVYLCVGAAIDFAAGTVRRAPKIMQRLGIEWMFRLVSEPRRLWRRYCSNAVGITRFLVISLVRRMPRPPRAGAVRG